jgi:hypothetical protein
MGASAWEYFTPYQADHEKAFHDLRQEVFESGNYFLYTPTLPSSEAEYLEQAYNMGLILTEQDEEWQREQYRKDKERYSKPKPETIEELIEWGAEDGTHTIIDMASFTDDPDCTDFFTAIPLSQAQLLELFETTKPTHQMIVEKRSAILNLRQRWQATYIIVYEDDNPTEIFFTGFSGD